MRANALVDDHCLQRVTSRSTEMQTLLHPGYGWLQKSLKKEGIECICEVSGHVVFDDSLVFVSP